MARIMIALVEREGLEPRPRHHEFRSAKEREREVAGTIISYTSLLVPSRGPTSLPALTTDAE
jgi:hypothetical protein